jgi:hypothetical protein
MDRRFLFLAVATLVLAGCPYGSEFPLSDPAEAVIDQALLGVWAGQSDDGDIIAMDIRASGAGRLAIVAADPTESDAESVPAFVTVIGGEKFLNVHDEAWFFLNYRIAAGTLRLRLVDDALFEGTSHASPAELRAFIQAHLADPLLYGREKGEAEAWDWVLQRSGAAPSGAAPPAAAPAPAATSP